MTTLVDLVEAFVSFRNKNGSDAAANLINNFGGKNGELTSVPEDNRADLLAAFGASTPGASTPGAPQAKLEAVTELDPDAIYRKWNSVKTNNQAVPREKKS